MEMINQLSESLVPWSGTESLPAIAAERVRVWWDRAQRVYPPNTQKAWRFDWSVFLRFCQSVSICPLPSSPVVVADFVRHCHKEGKRPATIQRYLSTVALAHRVANLVNPCKDDAVQLELKGLYNEAGARQRQARAIGWAEIERFLDTAGKSLPATRERALLCVAYDMMARRNELVALNVEDIKVLPDGTGRALLRRSKTDQAGEGNTAYLSRTTVKFLKAWLTVGGIKDGAVFRRVIGRGRVTTDKQGRGRIGGRLSVDAIAQAFKRVAEWIKLPPDEVSLVSGHSIRVGATQDLLALNIDLVSVMQAGRWKTNRMPARYGEHLLASRGGMARAAELQRRD